MDLVSGRRLVILAKYLRPLKIMRNTIHTDWAELLRFEIV